jgi:hypothetical protein
VRFRSSSLDGPVVEPPDLFKGRPSQKYADRDVGGDNTQVLATNGDGWVEDPDGPWLDAWHCGDIIIALVWVLSPRLAMKASALSICGCVLTNDLCCPHHVVGVGYRFYDRVCS